MDYLLNKNILVFNVPGAIDFCQSIVFEFYHSEEPDAEELSINDINHTFYEMYPIVGNYISNQIHIVQLRHHWNVRKMNVWVKCVKYFYHSHWGGSRSSDKDILKFSDAIKELKSEYGGYELNFNGYDYKTHLKELKLHFGTSIMSKGGEEEIKLTEREEQILNPPWLKNNK